VKKIIFDYLQRWFWTWPIMGVACFIGSGAEADTGTVFASWSFQILFFGGIFPLNYDLQRRCFPALITMPVTVRQIGRAWWFVCVGWPALLVATAQALGMFIFSHQHKFLIRLYGEQCLLSSLYLGTFFFVILAGPNRRPQTFREYIRMGFFAVLGLYLVCEVFRLRRGLTVSAEGITFVIVNSIATIAGWLGAGYFVSRRAGTRQIGPARSKKPPQFTAHGWEGIPLLLRHTVGRALLVWGVLLLAMSGASVVFHNHDDSSITVLVSQVTLAPLFPFWIIVACLLFPMLQQLRLLRTLPFSPLTLANLLVLLPVALMMVFAVSTALLVLFLAGWNQSLTLAEKFLIPLDSIVLCVPVVVGLGFNRSTMFSISVIFATMTITLIHRQIAWFPISLVSIIIVAASVFLTKQFLMRSRFAYRPPPDSLGNSWPWRR
jgi:hypothetical protein